MTQSRRICTVLFTTLLSTAGCAATTDAPEHDEKIGASSEALSATPVTIRTRLPGARCVDTKSSTNLSYAEIFDCWGGPNQSWTLYADGTIRGAAGRCLDVNGAVDPATAANGSIVQIYDCWGGGNQKWSYDVFSGEIRLAGTNKCLDVPGQSGDGGLHLQIWDCWGGQNQKWTIANSATPTIEEFEWSQYTGHPTIMWPVDKGLCMLTGMTGLFQGSGESVQVTNWNGYWVLTGSSMQNSVGARAKCVTWGDLGGYGYGTQSWSAMGFDNKMWDKGNFCGLSGVSGIFASTDSRAAVWFDGNDWWVGIGNYLLRDQAIGTCVGLKLNHPMALTGNATWNGSVAGTPQYLAEVNDAFCSLQEVSGPFRGGGEHVDIIRIGSAWYLTGGTMQSGTSARASCVKLHQY